MQIIELTLSHDNFYCPVTGHYIQGPEHFEPSPAMVAGWHSDIMDEPLTLSDTFAPAYNKFVEDLDEDDFVYDENLENFLKAIDAENLVCFKLNTSGIACGPVFSTVWFVIDFESQCETD